MKTFQEFMLEADSLQDKHDHPVRNKPRETAREKNKREGGLADPCPDNKFHKDGKCDEPLRELPPKMSRKKMKKS